MDTTQTTRTPQLLIFGRHIVGMALFALLNPLVYYHPEPVGWWLSLWLGSLAFSLAFFGLYYLFFTERAKAAWPRSFFMLAWVMVALITLEPYISGFNERVGQKAEKPQYPGLVPFNGKLDGE
jgi:hypothetical protein